MCIWPDCDTIPDYHKHLCLIHLEQYNKMTDIITKHKEQISAQKMLASQLILGGGVLILPKRYKDERS